MSKREIAGFWIISCTWGIIMTLIGAVVALALLITGHKPQLYHGRVRFEVGTGWGGFSCGGFIVTNKNPSTHLKQHEAGHSIQNIMLGIFMPFLVAIPSMIRYWYREYLVSSGKKKSSELPAYDSIWFEGWATSLGEANFPE